MKTFAELNEYASTISSGFDATPISDQTAKDALGFFAEVKYTCEQYADLGMIYTGTDGKFNLRLMRDIAIAGLNYSGNKQMLKARFYSVWLQINAIVYD